MPRIPFRRLAAIIGMVLCFGISLPWMISNNATQLFPMILAFAAGVVGGITVSNWLPWDMNGWKKILIRVAIAVPFLLVLIFQGPIVRFLPWGFLTGLTTWLMLMAVPLVGLTILVVFRESLDLIWPDDRSTRGSINRYRSGFPDEKQHPELGRSLGGRQRRGENMPRK